MGGELAWTLRLEDGTEYRMNQWTNTIHGLFMNPDFLHGKQSAIDHALEKWLALKSDWDANKKTQRFARHETSIYAPYPFGMKPSEYGIIVTDFVSKKILTLQNYTTLGHLTTIGLTSGPHALPYTDNAEPRLKAFSELGQIKNYRFLVATEASAKRLASLGGNITPHRHDNTALWVTLPGSVDLEALTGICEELRTDVPPHPEQEKISQARKDLERLPADDPEREKGTQTLDILQSAHTADHNPFKISGHAEIDPSPFEIETFADNWIGYQDMLSRIRDLGFDLTIEEFRAWGDRIEYAKEKANEDA